MRGIINYIKLIIHRNFYSLKAIESYQLKQLKYLVSYARNNSTFYRHSLSEHHIETLSDFKKLPLINKSVMMEHFDLLNTVGLTKDEVMSYALKKELEKDYLGYYRDKFVIGLSSGTSGNKGLFITPKSLTKQLPFVFLARSGLPLRYLPFKILFMLRVFSQGFNDINSPIISLNYLSTMTPIQDVIEHINNLKINILMAPPSLCRLLLPYSHLIQKPLKMIVTYAEVLEKEEKQRLRSIFKCNVIEIYQASEGQLASACSHGNLHINEDLVYVELLDDQYNEVTDAHVVANHMVVTNLVNLAQPLIRYEMNDLIVLDDHCSCGSHFRTIKNIVGRNDDVLTFKKNDGTMQHIFPDLMSRWIMTSSENIREYKVVQHKNHSLSIIIDPLKDEGVDELKHSITQKLRKECQSYGISLTLDVLCEPLTLPVDRSKYKRFVVEKE